MQHLTQSKTGLCACNTLPGGACSLATTPSPAVPLYIMFIIYKLPQQIWDHSLPRRGTPLKKLPQQTSWDHSLPRRGTPLKKLPRHGTPPPRSFPNCRGTTHTAWPLDPNQEATSTLVHYFTIVHHSILCAHSRRHSETCRCPLCAHSRRHS